VQTSKGRRVFGAGIASSFAECAYALSRKPNVKDFDLEQIRRKDFRIDQVQADLFLIRNPQVLYTCLDQFERPFQG
jgi:phenylalanine-4-hydroxylase